MSTEEQYMNGMLEDIRSSSTAAPMLMPLPSLESPNTPPQQSAPGRLGGPGDFNGTPNQPTNPYASPYRREPSAMEKIKSLGSLIASTYHQAAKVESDHDNRESYASTDKHQRMSLMQGLEKMAVDLDNQANAVKRGNTNIQVSAHPVDVVVPNTPQFVNTTQVQPSNYTAPYQPQAKEVPIVDNQMELDFGEYTPNDIMEKCVKLSSQLEDIRIMLIDLHKKCDIIINDQPIKKK